MTQAIDTFYGEYLEKQPYPYQIEVWEKMEKMNFPLFINAPTGSGKTEAVIAPFLEQFVSCNFYIAPRMIYVLPMRVLINSVATRIERYAKKISPNILVKVQHGDIPNSPFFMGDIVVTTLDQFLYGFARASRQVGKHIDFPAGAIASSIVVFDEAHMYRDEFTFSIMRALMEILHQSKIPFVVMTATMPQSLEKSLFENINLSDMQRISSNTPVNSRLKIIIENEPLYANDKVKIPDRLLSRMTTEKTLIVANQVKRAQMVFDYIKSKLGLSENQIVLLHSRFTTADRKNNEKRAMSLLIYKENGKIKIPEGTGIVISTQVLEAGIDFSANLLITELAPADSLIQRAGRCARYPGESGEMVIFPVEDGDIKGYLPYKQDQLEKALEWLKNNRNFNIKNFDEVCSFVNETLDYQANDYEARDTLLDLYECVLYADNRPSNIQLREGKPIILVVVDLSKGKGRSIADKIRDAIRAIDIRDNCINVDIGVGWKLLKDEILKFRLIFDENQGAWDFNKAKDKDILPFSYYLLDSNNYDKHKGMIPDVACFII
ncbi:MAG: CRISPR-associated helicase Cas3' [Candidatus Omnitrophica bacterium]|nr:CRISPR-associated helicase Cas3' [Candidatus Omnitrophota bacterium]